MAHRYSDHKAEEARAAYIYQQELKAERDSLLVERDSLLALNRELVSVVENFRAYTLAACAALESRPETEAGLRAVDEQARALLAKARAQGVTP